ncbi:MAG: PHP domain-containing protein [bacterium]
MAFVHLHGHSTFSFLEAIGKPNKIISRAKELGMDAIALTDYNGMYGCIKLYQTAKEENIKPIIGVELGFVLDHNSPILANQIGNIVLISKSKAGYANLMEIVSFANKEGVTGKAKIDIPFLQEHKEGIIAIIGGKQSRIGKMILIDEKEEKITEILNMLQETIGKDNLFLEITAQDEHLLPEIKKINTTLLAISHKYNIKCIVDNNYHYITSTDKEAREIALAIKDGKKIYDEDRRKPLGNFSIMSEEEIRSICSKNGYSPEQIDERMNTNVGIASEIVTDIALNQTLFPNYASPEDIIELYEKNKGELVVEG